MIKVFSWLKSTATAIFCGHCFSSSLSMKKRGMLILPSIGQPKRELLQKYEKTELFKVRVIFSFTLFGVTHQEAKQSIPQSFTSQQKCRHSKIFIKLFIVPTNLDQTEDSEEHIWPLLPPKLVLQLAILKGHVITSVSWPSYKIYQVANPYSRRWQLSQTINFLCLDNFDCLFFKCTKIFLYKSQFI